jgi:hypothetical protein
LGTGRRPYPIQRIAAGSMEPKEKTRQGSNRKVIAILVLVVLAFYLASFMMVRG